VTEITDILQKAQFKVTHVFYSDSLGFFSSLVFKVLGSKDGAASPKSLLFYDRYIFPLSTLLDRLICHKFFGKNILIVGEKASCES